HVAGDDGHHRAQEWNQAPAQDACDEAGDGEAAGLADRVHRRVPGQGEARDGRATRAGRAAAETVRTVRGVIIPEPGGGRVRVRMPGRRRVRPRPARCRAGTVVGYRSKRMPWASGSESE